MQCLTFFESAVAVAKRSCSAAASEMLTIRPAFKERPSNGVFLLHIADTLES